jgi:capsular exopolysaccharide synthesis family protein
VVGGLLYVAQPRTYESRAKITFESTARFDQFAKPISSVWLSRPLLETAAEKLMSDNAGDSDAKSLAGHVQSLRSNLRVAIQKDDPVSILLSFRGRDAERVAKSLSAIVDAGLPELQRLKHRDGRLPLYDEWDEPPSREELVELIARRNSLKRKIRDLLLHDSKDESIIPAAETPGTAGRQPEQSPIGSQRETEPRWDVVRLKFLVDSAEDEIKSLRARMNIVNLVEQPMVPQWPLKVSGVRFSVVALAFGLFAGCVTIFLVERVQDRFHSHVDVEAILGLPILTTVPADAMEVLADKSFSIAADESNDDWGESFAGLCKSLESSSAAVRCITITSGEQGVGKTAVAFNLARAFARAGRSTLLIDADLRADGLSGQLKLQAFPGLTGVLRQQQEFVESIRPHADLDGLNVLPSGVRVNRPIELLASSGLGRLLETARQQYDQIIIDAPMAVQFADAAILGQISDGVLCVVHSRQSKTASSLSACHKIASFGGDLLGVVVNRDRSWKSSISSGQSMGIGRSRQAAGNHSTAQRRWRNIEGAGPSALHDDVDSQRDSADPHQDNAGETTASQKVA